MQHYASPTGTNESVYAIACDSGGNVFLTGRMYNGESELDDVVAMKLDAADGHVVWTRLLGGADHQDDAAWAIAVGSDGDPVLTGIFGRADGNADFCTAKLDSADGTTIWQKVLPGAVNNIGERAGWILLCSDDDALVTNRMWEPATLFDVVAFRFDASDGEVVWQSRYGAPGAVSDNPRAAASDRDGNLLVAGVQSGDFLVCKFACGDGELQWRSLWDAPAHDYDGASAIAVSGAASGEIVAGGFSSAAATGWDATLVGFDPADGSIAWSSIRDSGDGLTDEVSAIAASPLGDLYAVGYGYTWITQQDLLSIGYRQDSGASVADATLRPPVRLAAYPNPFAGEVTLRLEMAAGAAAAVGDGRSADVEVIDASGRLVRSLAATAGPVAAGGTLAFVWRGENEAGNPVPSGIYFVRVRGAAGGIETTRKISLRR
ncbi:MAG: PQQ-binding-like beta-propeller repeat protein [Candidatus Eisenbacteria bacterium]